MAYYLFKDTKFLSNFGINRRKEKEEYKNLDITDADYEATMVMMNRKLQPNLDTVLLYTSLEYQFVSSTLIKEVAKYKGDVSEFVSEHVANAIKMKYANGS